MGEPFLKWPGGKRWLADRLVPLIRRSLTGRYFEPFLGGGAAFFASTPAVATLSDINEDLINTYARVRDSSEEIISALRKLTVSKRAYLAVRASEPDDAVERAVRFLYLNRTAFGGMYRVNRRGHFNVPYGGGERTPEILWKTDLLRDAATALADVELVISDFEPVIDEARFGDVVYCDPTYTVAHENNGFVRYNERIFSWADQTRLAAAVRRAGDRGAVVIVSNAFHESIRELYRGMRGERVDRLSLISRDADARRAVNEYLFVVGQSARDRKNDHSSVPQQRRAPAPARKARRA